MRKIFSQHGKKSCEKYDYPFREAEGSSLGSRVKSWFILGCFFKKYDCPFRDVEGARYLKLQCHIARPHAQARAAVARAIGKRRAPAPAKDKHRLRGGWLRRSSFTFVPCDARAAVW